MGPRVSEANRSTAAFSRATVRIESVTRLLSGVHSSVDVGAMRSGPVIATGDAGPPAVFQTRSDNTGAADPVERAATRIASRFPSRENAAWRTFVRTSPSGNRRSPVLVSMTTSRRAEGATYVGSP